MKKLLKKDAILAWHILPRTMKLGYGDGRIAEVGKTLSVRGMPELCFRGLHASENLRDAERYGPEECQSKVCRVLVFGQVITDGYWAGSPPDKIVGTSRKILYSVSIRRVNGIAEKLRTPSPGGWTTRGWTTHRIWNQAVEEELDRLYMPRRY